MYGKICSVIFLSRFISKIFCKDFLESFFSVWNAIQENRTNRSQWFTLVSRFKVPLCYTRCICLVALWSLLFMARSAEVKSQDIVSLLDQSNFSRDAQTLLRSWICCERNNRHSLRQTRSLALIRVKCEKIDNMQLLLWNTCHHFSFKGEWPGG